MSLQILPKGAPQYPHARSVHDSHPRKPGEKSAVEKFLQLPRGILDVQANHFQFRRRALVLVAQANADSLLARRLHGAVGGAGR